MPLTEEGRFNPRALHVGTTVYRVTLGQVNLRLLRLYSLIITPRKPHTHSSSISDNM
jgi:hypothetical protein